MERESDAADAGFKKFRLIEVAQYISLEDTQGLDLRRTEGGKGARVKSRHFCQVNFCSVGVHYHDIVVAKVRGLRV